MKNILVAILFIGTLMDAGCQPKGTGDSAPQPSVPLPSWPRNSFQPTGAKALVWYQVYGRFPDTIEISRSKYRCSGIPEGIEVRNYRRTDGEGAVTSFLTRPFFAAGLKRELSELAAAVEAAPEYTIIRGETPDSTSLDYLRDVVGLVTWFLDNGGLAVLDPQTFRWYDREKWRSELFGPNVPVPRHHVVIVYSEEDGIADESLFWLHTRGMRKFARPDLSVHDVPAQYRGAAIDLLNRLIEIQAFGQAIAEGQPVNMQSLPPGMTCRHAGSLNDPDFNNTHIEIRWPK